MEELKTPETWVHAEVDIRANGRCQVKEAPPEDDEGGGEGGGATLSDKSASFFKPFGAQDAPPDHDVSSCKPLLRSIAEVRVRS